MENTKGKSFLTMDSMKEHDMKELNIDSNQTSNVEVHVNKNTEKHESKKIVNIPDIFNNNSDKDLRVGIITKVESNNNNSISDAIISNAVMVECDMVIKIPMFKTIDVGFYESIVKNMNLDPKDIAKSILKVNIDGININEIITEAILLQLTNKNE